MSPSRPLDPLAAGASPIAHARRLLLTTFAGRGLVAGIALKLIVLAIRAATGTDGTAVQVLDRLGSLGLVVGGGLLLYRLVAVAQRRLLWRVRRKLIISYIFIGVVPALLIVAFFLVAGAFLFLSLSAYLIQDRLNDLTRQAEFHARTAAVEIARGDTVQRVVTRKVTNLRTEFPAVSMAVLPAGDRPCGGETARRMDVEAVTLGAWPFIEPPASIPEWIDCRGFTGMIASVTPEAHAAIVAEAAASTNARQTRDDANATLRDDAYLTLRAVALADGVSPPFAVVIDLPIDDIVAGRLREETGIRLQRSSFVRRRQREGAGGPALPAVVRTAPRLQPPSATADSDLPWVTLLGFVDWSSGGRGSVTTQTALSFRDIYNRLSAAQGRVGGRDLAQMLLWVLAIISVLFLIIQVVALVMGLALARSITGSVHELFTGTERVRHGDFSHRIRIDARDQLGDLADSFNSMTGSIEELLLQAAEKKRLEEELRIARQIQMSLLPQGPLQIPGLSVTALCVPAREVGGDYYDFLPLGDDRVGIIVADVSGKGTSAALYMAELKGLMLSLSQIHASPRELLIHANRIIADNLDSRSFITMTYAVFDMRARTMTYARAGHTPLIHVPGAGATRSARILAPDGLVLGLKIDGGEKFDALLEEQVIALAAGDLFLLFTDGLSEAMNEWSDCFGEARLGALVEEHGHLPFDELRERILRDIEAFVGGAAQHDDMTMILLKVEETAGAEVESGYRLQAAGYGPGGLQA